MPGFMDKETLEREAERLHVDLEGLKWPQKQQAVFAAQTREKNGEEIGEPEAGGMRPQEPGSFFSSDAGEDMRVGDTDGDYMPTAQKPVHIHVDVPFDPMADMRGKRVLICPEMAETPNQLFGYDEELDEEIVVEEVRHDVDSAYKAGKDLVTGTYTVKEKTGRKVVAHTALPKEGCGVEFYPDRDWVPVVTHKGRRGYLWTHHRLPNIKQLLIESGYYEDYRHRFKDEPFVWHASGKLLCCDINLANSVLREIEHRVAEEKVRREQNTEYIKRQLG